MRENRNRKRKNQRVSNSSTNNRLLFFIALLIAILLCTIHLDAHAAEPKSKFYDFSDQLIDGEIKQPQGIYMDARVEAKFKRLLKLKRNFLGDHINKTARERIFK